MQDKYIEFFEILPKTTQLSLRMLVPNKYNRLDTNTLACVFILHGILKKCIISQLKECTDRIVNSVTKTVDIDDKKINDFCDIELTEECQLLIDRFNYFKNFYSSKITSEIITAFVSYVMVTDSRLLCYKLFDECIYVNAKVRVKTELESEIKNGLNIRLSSVIKPYGKYMNNPLNPIMYSCFGREDEIQECIDILSRLNKANLILVGNPGVGKTCVVEGICNYLQSDKCPEKLKETYIFQLDVNSLISGTTYRGDLEKRLQDILTELTTYKNIILFVDEIHTMLNKPSGENGSTSIQNVLKPYLCDGLRVIGCTTEQEYMIVEKDKAFERRFSKVVIKELSKEKTVETLISKKYIYENYHSVTICDDVCKTIVRLCDRYMKNKYFPDKAFDVLDVSCVECVKRGSTKVTDKYIATVVEKLSGINTNAFDLTSLGDIERKIRDKIIGQDTAITTLFKYIKKYYIGLNNKTKPIANLLFVGPTGTGKTELCKQFAENVFTPESFIRYDMSEFMESHSISKLIGSPPGYIGYDCGGSLTEKVKHNPFSVILFDEIEKAHKDVINILLQIMDDGRLTDSFGSTIDFCNTVVIMTSNIGCKDFLEKSSLGFNNNSNSNFITNKIHDFFSPEFINRLDDIVYFNKISDVVFEKILSKELNEIVTNYEKSCNMHIDISNSFVPNVKKDIYDEKNGVRFIRKKLCDMLDPVVIEKLYNNVRSISIDYVDGLVVEDINEKSC